MARTWTASKDNAVEFRQSFRKCVIIIDCFEIFMERATDLKARGQTWSNYKHHNTIKFLIGITPQGTISFISKGWGGRVSDWYLTEKCGLLEKLLPGDVLLADRGFNVQESAGVYCAEVKIPPFTKGKSQLNKFEVDTSRKLSWVRIHVERVIGLLRQNLEAWSMEPYDWTLFTVTANHLPWFLLPIQKHQSSLPTLSVGCKEWGVSQSPEISDWAIKDTGALEYHFPSSSGRTPNLKNNVACFKLVLINSSSG